MFRWLKCRDNNFYYAFLSMITALRFNKTMRSMEVDELRANLPEPSLTRKDLLPHVEFASPVQDDRVELPNRGDRRRL